MAVGRIGLPGEPAVSHVAMDQKCAVALAPIHLRQPEERSALGTQANNNNAIQELVHVSIFLQNILQKDVLGFGELLTLSICRNIQKGFSKLFSIVVFNLFWHSKEFVIGCPKNAIGEKPCQVINMLCMSMLLFL